MEQVKDLGENNWTDDVFQSMEGYTAVHPPGHLFEKIEARIEGTSTKLISINQWKYTAAAAVIILMINLGAVLYYMQNSTDTDVTSEASISNSSLFNNYLTYER